MNLSIGQSVISRRTGQRGTVRCVIPFSPRGRCEPCYAVHFAGGGHGWFIESELKARKAA